MSKEVESTFGSKRASELTGLTRAMVDYLCRSRVLVPSVRDKPGHGKGRRYSFGDLVMLRALGRLLSLGLPVSKLKEALTVHQRLYSEITPQSALPRYLVTDGTQVLFEERPGKFVNLTKGGQLTFAFIVDMRQARADVEHARKLQSA